MNNNQPRNALPEPPIQSLVRLQSPRQRRLVRALPREKQEGVPPRNHGGDGGEETREEGIVRDQAGGREVARTNADDLLAFKVGAYGQHALCFWRTCGEDDFADEFVEVVGEEGQGRRRGLGGRAGTALERILHCDLFVLGGSEHCARFGARLFRAVCERGGDVSWPPPFQSALGGIGISAGMGQIRVDIKRATNKNPRNSFAFLPFSIIYYQRCCPLPLHVSGLIRSRPKNLRE